MEQREPAEIPAACPDCGLVAEIRREQVYEDLTCEGCGTIFVVMREKIRNERRAVPAECPECGDSSIVGHRDVGRDLVCNACGTSYVVLREKRRRRQPSSLRSTEDVEALIPDPNRSRGPFLQRWGMLMSWVATLIVVLFVLKHCGAFKKAGKNIDKLNDVTEGTR